jgi:hypothetical protein
MRPLLQLARQQTTQTCTAYGLVVHDWSGLDYSGHTAKKDRIRLAGDAAGLGYELYAALLLYRFPVKVSHSTINGGENTFPKQGAAMIRIQLPQADVERLQEAIFRRFVTES